MLTVDDGDILAIGGLLNDDERRTIERIPLLSDIPVIGELFRSRSRSRAKTNLMVFIRPTILRDRADNAALTARRYNYVRADQLARDPDSEPEIDLLVRDYLGTVPPGVVARSDDQVIGAARALPAPVEPVDIPPSDAGPPPPQG